MDLNLVLIKGRPVVEPKVVTFSDGVSFMRLKMGVRVDYPSRRLDVLAVVWWQPSDATIADPP